MSLRMPSYRSLPRSHYEFSTVETARALLGHYLVRRTASDPMVGIIVETEAYLAEDPACHAYRGVTPRNRVMFGPPGHAYVYFIYGCHFCVNAVCRPAGIGEAVLIRALQPLAGVDQMRSYRPVGDLGELLSGPGKLCQALSIGRELNGADLCDSSSPLFIAESTEPDHTGRERREIVTVRRVGLTRGKTSLLRFYLAGNPFVSRK